MTDLFDAIPDRRPIPPLDPRVPDEAKPRLSRQCHAILAALRERRRTNRELIDIAMNFTARISELRAVGHDVKVVEEDKKSGYALYGLFACGVEVSRK